MATINGVEVIGDKSAHDFDLLDKNDGINLSNGIERNRKSAEDNHEDIVRHRTDADVHVTPEWKNSLVTKAILGLYWTAAQTADIINEISIAGGAKLVKVDVLPAVGLEQTIYLVPKADPQAGDVFDEYVWVDGKYEFIGTTKANLSNYYTKVETDYLFSQLDFKYVKSDDTTLVRLVNENEINLQEDHYNAWFGYRDGKVTNWKFGDGTEGGLADVYVKDLYLGDQKLSELLGAKALDSDTVHKTGTETISGIKTFVNPLTVTRPNIGTTGYVIKLTFKRGDDIASINHSTFRVTDSEDIIVSEVCTENYVDGKVAQILNVRNTTADGAQVQSSISHLLDKTGEQDWLYSVRDGKTFLGTSAYKWADVNTNLINGETVVTPTYLNNKTENWEFTLSDGSTVTKKIVMA